MIKRWLSYDKDYTKVKDFVKELNISETLARILINRNVETIEDAKVFLNPVMDELHNPFNMKGMEPAVCRLEKAIKNGEKICIYGDYDVDGITSVSILYMILKELGANVVYYIPNRLDEGYGLNTEAIEKILNDDVDLIVTVDCGINSINEVELVNKRNRDIIITDHHQCSDILPEAYSVLNPNQRNCNYPFKYLAGAGVAFKLVSALAQKMGRYEIIKNIIDLAALGTVADVVTLLGENRIIVKNGLDKMRSHPNIGIEALAKVSGVDISNINTYHLSFIFGPRLNAAGRLSNPSLGVELLTAEDRENAYEIAKVLNEINMKRQKIENDIIEEAINLINREVNLKREKVIVLAADNWHIGVVGIVASKITEKYNLPTVLISVDGDIGRGSARSVPNFDLYKAMSRCSFLFEKFGGHQMAAGFVIKKENISKLKHLINKVVIEMLDDKEMVPEILVDYKIDSINTLPQLMEEIEMLKPHGEGNPVPVFIFRNLIIKDMRLLSNNKHLLLQLSDGTDIVKGIGFNIGFIFNYIAVNEKIDIICSVEKNIWNGTESIQLNIKDINKAK